MKKLILILFILLNCIFFNLQAEEKSTDVLIGEIENINVVVSTNNITIIELEKEIQGFENLSNYAWVKKLSNKLVLVSIKDEYFPAELGKIILTDSACNVYVLNIVKEDEQKDRAFYIKNSKTEKECEALNDRAYYPTGVKYSKVQK